jgi:hypothetical protein
LQKVSFLGTEFDIALLLTGTTLILNMRKILAFILVLCLMVAGTGVPVFAHKCMHSGEVTVSVLPVECSMHHEGLQAPRKKCIDKGTCCKLDYNYLKTDLNALQKVPTQLKALELMVPVVPIPTYLEKNYAGSTYFGIAPPDYLASAQPMLCTFRI